MTLIDIPKLKILSYLEGLWKKKDKPAPDESKGAGMRRVEPSSANNSSTNDAKPLKPH